MNLKYNLPIFISSISLILLSAGCKKPLLEPNIHPLILNKSLIYNLPSTDEEKRLVENLVKITEILKELYKEKKNLEEVNAAIFSQLYTDGSILLKDLIYPETRVLNTNIKFLELMKNWNCTPGNFAKNFWTEVKKRNDLSLKKFLVSLENVQVQGKSPIPDKFPISFGIDQVTIYFPYIENFNASAEAGNYRSSVTNIAAATADADEGIAYQPFYDISGTFLYRQIILNDRVAMLSPTHIVGVNDIHERSHPPSMVAGKATSGSPVNAGLPREVKQVYIGEVRCRKQYDALISFTGNGGGSEIRFVRGDGFLKEQDGQVQSADVFIIADSRSISRSEINNERWINYSMGWDEDWEPKNNEQFFAIFEEDTRNSTTYKFGVETTVRQIDDVSLGGTIDGTFNFKSDDNMIKQTNYKFDSFFSLNRINLEGEMKNGWPVRDKQGSVSFTLTDRTIF